MSLHKDYRPDELDMFVGSLSTIKALNSKINSNDAPHVYLITGPSGCGKTTLGRIIARHFKSLLEDETPGNSRNYKELDSADFRGIDTIREIRRSLNYAPQGKASSRCFLLDECHQLSNDAQEALLKALEETPDHIYFILATTNPEKLKDTLKRRCHHFEVSALGDDEMSDFLSNIIDEEEKKVPEKVLESIVESSMGSPGKALVLLDKIIDMKSKDMLKQIETTAAQFNKSIDLCLALINKKSWSKIKQILIGLKKENPESIRIHIMKFCSGSLLKKENERAYLIMDSFREPFYGPDGFEKLVLCSYESLYAE